MAKTIKQWVADRIRAMEKHAVTRKAKKQSLQEESKMLEDWKKYEKVLAQEIKMLYNNNTCWRNVNFSNQCSIANNIVYDLRMEDTDE